MNKSSYIILLCSFLTVQVFGSFQALLFVGGSILGIALIDLLNIFIDREFDIEGIIEQKSILSHNYT